jgi:hypothetical protein
MVLHPMLGKNIDLRMPRPNFASMRLEPTMKKLIPFPLAASVGGQSQSHHPWRHAASSAHFLDGSGSFPCSTSGQRETPHTWRGRMPELGPILKRKALRSTIAKMS